MNAVKGRVIRSSLGNFGFSTDDDLNADTSVAAGRGAGAVRILRLGHYEALIRADWRASEKASR